MNDTIAAAVAKKELPPMEPEALCYMMSKEGTTAMSFHTAFERDVLLFADRPHNLGANLPGSPVFAAEDPLGQLTQFVIPVQHWSERTDDHQAQTHVHP